jgi:glycine/D-amino acid oxidase-like deaminating enzyme
MTCFNSDQLRVPLTRIGGDARYDVIVCGGGPSGCAAALAAARSGLRCLVIECAGQLGGMGTSGLVSHWLGGRTSDGSKWVVGGIFKELSVEAAAGGIALLPVNSGEKYPPQGWVSGLQHGIPFNPYAMAAFLDRKMQVAGVTTLFMSRAVGVEMSGSRLTGVVVAMKEGLTVIEASAFVDATGDADLAFFAGCEVVKGREEDSLMTPATLMMHVDNVDQDFLARYIRDNDTPRFRKEIETLRQTGEWDFPYDIFISVQLEEKGVMMINTSRLCGVDGCDTRSLSEGLARGRAESLRLFAVMKRHFPGFAQARIKSLAPLMGVRETRRIKALEILRVDDLANGRKYSSTIGLSSYGWDLPDPKRPSHQPLTERQQPKSPFTPIPFGIMVPQGVDNLICPGRAVGVERDVLGPLRVMAPCMAMGEAAGVAALHVVQGGGSFKTVDIEAVRGELRRRGAIIEENGIA